MALHLWLVGLMWLEQVMELVVVERVAWENSLGRTVGSLW